MPASADRQSLRSPLAIFALAIAAFGSGWAVAYRQVGELRDSNQSLKATLAGMQESLVVSPKTSAPYAKPVSAEELQNGGVLVLGRLGLPLGTMTSVRGTWHDLDREAAARGAAPTSKRRGMQLRISHVNGKSLDTPVEFPGALVEVTYPLPWAEREASREPARAVDGDTWKFRAYERGGFSNTPKEYYDELGGMMPVAPAWSRRFQTGLHGIMQRPSDP